MFKTTLKYSINPEKSTVTFRPTLGTIVRAFAPSVLMGVGFLAYGAYLDKKIEKEMDDIVDPLD